MSAFYIDERRAKVERSIEHLRQFEKEVTDFCLSEDPPHRVHADLESEVGERREYRIWLEVLRQPPVLRWSLLISDVIQNLRMPLDYVAWMLALNHDRARALSRPQDIYFPISLKAADFWSHRTRPYVSAMHWTRLEKFQPYKRTGPPEFDPLARLHLIAREDRHRILHSLRLVFDELVLDPACFHHCEFMEAEHASRGTALNQGTQLGRVNVRITGSAEKVEVQPAFFCFVEFAEVPHTPVIKTLQEIGPRVMLAISAFDPQFEEIGIADILAKPPDTRT